MTTLIDRLFHRRGHADSATRPDALHAAQPEPDALHAEQLELSDEEFTRLVSVLREGNEEDRRGAVDGLEPFGERAVDPLCTHLLTEHDFRVRREAVAVLGRLGDARAVDAILASTGSLEARGAIDEEATEALRRLATPTERLLCELVDGTPDRRRGAIEVLGRLQDSATLPALIAALDDTDPTVRVRVPRALEKVGSPEAIDALLGKLDDPDPGLRCTAARALGSLAGGWHVTLEGRTVHRVRSEPPHRPDVTERLTRLVTDAERSVRWAAIEALREITGFDGRLPRPAIEAVAAMLADNDYDTRVNACAVLLETDDAGDVVRAVLRDTRRGGMDEPYCSQECYDRGGEAIAEVILKTPGTGPEVTDRLAALSYPNCCVCGRSLSLTRGSFVCFQRPPDLILRRRKAKGMLTDPESPLPGVPAGVFFHHKPECVDRLRDVMARTAFCVACGVPLPYR